MHTDPTNAARATLAAQSHRATRWSKALANDGREKMRLLALIGKGHHTPTEVLAGILLEHFEKADGTMPFAICGSLHRWNAGNWYSVPYRELSMSALAAFEGLAGCKGPGDAVGVADCVLVLAAKLVADIEEVVV
jgi:hypothetical protein